MEQQKPYCAIANRLYDAFLAGDIEGIFILLHPDIVWELVGSDEVPHFGRYQGVEAVRAFFDTIGRINRVKAFEVLSLTETEKGAYAECREQGHFQDHPKEFDLRSCQILEIQAGLITRFTIYQDTSQMVDAWRS
ncbi:nuclear transport factor 2 family protein [uncultured Shewanella sp.]|uniref:nuclear transport factor 2 family protein n=1 Tax=uncultured Shewanella sp. TaxID=173975 RepID=UPI002633E106|nr:nuclear transport factor 2 family protein [uncultured Shewanella sp.]